MARRRGLVLDVEVKEFSSRGSGPFGGGQCRVHCMAPTLLGIWGPFISMRDSNCDVLGTACMLRPA